MQNQTTILVFALTFALLLYLIRQILKAFRETIDLTHKQIDFIETKNTVTYTQLSRIHKDVEIIQKDLIYLRNDFCSLQEQNNKNLKITDLGIIVISHHYKKIYSSVQNPLLNTDLIFYTQSIYKEGWRKQMASYSLYELTIVKPPLNYLIPATFVDVSIIFTNVGDNIAKK